MLRNVSARPARTAAAVVGVASAMSILVVGAFWNDAVATLLDQQFRLVMREDVTVTFVSPARDRALRELAHLPGVRRVEGLVAVPARVSAGLREKRIELLGLPPGGALRRLIRADGSEMALPAEGMVISAHLARRLAVGPGARVVIEALDGARPRRVLPVAAVLDELIGMTGYMRADALARLLDRGPSVSAALLAFEPGRDEAALRALRRLPQVASVTVKRAMLWRFETKFLNILVVFSAVLTTLAGLVVAGVVYNAARILVAERERELATLRVLGFTRADASEAFLLELAVQVIPALPVGALIGYGLSAIAVGIFGPEDMSIPLIVGPRTWGIAFATVIASAVASALVVRRRLDRLDLVSLLKVRE